MTGVGDSRAGPASAMKIANLRIDPELLERLHRGAAEAGETFSALTRRVLAGVDAAGWAKFLEVVDLIAAYQAGTPALKSVDDNTPSERLNVKSTDKQRTAPAAAERKGGRPPKTGAESAPVPAKLGEPSSKLDQGREKPPPPATPDGGAPGRAVGRVSPDTPPGCPHPRYARHVVGGITVVCRACGAETGRLAGW